METRRRLIKAILPLLSGTAAFCAVALFAGITGLLLYRGGAALDLGFLTAEMREAGASGGIRYQIAGTIILIATALAVACPLAVGLAVARVVLLRRRPWWARRLDDSLQVLNSIPSIVFGIIGMVVFLKLCGWGKSWLAGGIILGWMILPTAATALISRMNSLPAAYLEAAAGLGLTEEQITRSVLLPLSWNGLVTGSFLGLARAAGETAPILFTAAVFSGATIPSGIRDNPVLALPYHIFVLAQDSFGDASRQNLWGTALVLILLVALLSLPALLLRARLHEESSYD